MSNPDDQRRSRRHDVRLEVDLHFPGWVRRVTATNVSRHGLFVEINDPLRERQLIQTGIHIPGHTIHATAFVTRAVRNAFRAPQTSEETVAPIGGAPGMGLSLFALSSAAKERWERFVFQLSGGDPRELPTPYRPDQASFLLRFASVDRLRDFQVRTLPSGLVYLQSPIIRPPRTEVSVVLIHPDSAAEFSLPGVVHRIHDRSPRGMEIRLEPLTDDHWERFFHFVATGVTTAALTPEPVFDIDEADPSDDVFPLPVLDANPSDQFDWGSVSNAQVFDLDLAGVNESTMDASPIDPTTEQITQLPEPIQDLGYAARVSCSACGFESALRLGDADGQLGLLAHFVPYWSPSEETLVSIPRLKPLAERQAARARLQSGELDAQVPLAFAFDIADLTMAPKSESGAKLRYNDACASLLDAAPALEQDASIVLSVPCEKCRGGPWKLTRVAL